MLQLNIKCSGWWVYVPKTCQATNTSINLPFCIKLAFHIISWRRCRVKKLSKKNNSLWSCKYFEYLILPLYRHFDNLCVCHGTTEFIPCESYVYWTMHHLDSWIKREQLDVTCFIISLFNVQHVSDVNTSILRSLRLICWVISWVVLLWFDECGIRMQASACIWIPHHHSQTTT